MAILNEGKTLAIKDIVNRVKEYHTDVNKGSIYNIGAKEKKIQKTDNGWELKEGSEAPILCKGYVWGPKHIFQQQDLAAFRRMAIRHLLDIFPDGLQIMQIFRQLKDVDWLNTPFSKDLIEDDLKLMKSMGKVRTLGNTKKWTFVKHKISE